MQATSSSTIDLALSKDLFAFNLTTPKHNHKLIAQIHVERQLGNYMIKLHAINPEWHETLDPLTRKLSERLIVKGEEQRFIPLTHEDLACELLGLDSSKTIFSEYSCGQKSTFDLLGARVEISTESWGSEHPLPPDIIDVKIDSEQLTSLRFEKCLSLSSKDQVECFNLGVYAIGKELGGGGFSNIFLARNTRTNIDFAIEVVDLTKNKDRFERSRAVFTRLQSSEYIVKLHEAFVLPASQIGCLVEDIAHVDMKYGRDLFKKGIDDNRIRIIAKQLLEIINNLDQYNVLHDEVAPVDFLYFKNSGKIKVGGLEKANLVFDRHNSLNVVAQILDSLVWGYGESKEKPDWLSKEMFDFMSRIRYSNTKAEHAMKSKIFERIGDKPRLIVAVPEIKHFELKYI